MVPCPECGEMQPAGIEFCQKRKTEALTPLARCRHQLKWRRHQCGVVGISLILALLLLIFIASGLWTIVSIVESLAAFFAGTIRRCDVSAVLDGSFLTFLLALVLYRLLSNVFDRVGPDWYSASLTEFLSLHPEYWDIHGVLNDTGWEVKLRLPILHHRTPPA
jgi:hypothetical protein